MKYLSLLALLPLLSACSHDVNTCDLAPHIDYTKPGVLIIGDSVSIGYTPYVRGLVPQADIIHNACNAETAQHALGLVDTYLDYRFHWSVVTFNQGLWNLNTGSIADYQASLKAEGLKLQGKADHVIFFTSTQFDTTRPNDNLYMQELNAAAITTMNQLNIEVVDLYAPAMQLQHDLVGSPHFTEPSYQVLASIVSDAIKGVLP